MIHDIPSDILSIIGTNLSYKEFTLLRDAANLKISNKSILTNCSLLSKENNLTNTLNLYGISHKDFWKTLFNSAYNTCDLTELLDDIVNNSIDNKRKDYNILFDYFKTNSSHIENTITVTQIILITIEDRVRKRFIINNPYSYINIMIINSLINYFQIVVCSSDYDLIRDMNKSTFKFNLILFDSSWYLSNLNIFNLFLLYLLETDTISSSTNEIYAICCNSRIESKLQFSNQVFWFELESIFHGSKHQKILQDIIYQCKN